MSEIDFAEIEKAMAELVGKAQGKERQQGLGQVAKERSAIAKQVETAHEQGNIATKRIIVASNKLRSNPHPTSRPVQQVTSPHTGRVMDFVKPVASTYNSPSLDSKPIEIQTPISSDEVQQDELQKTVGELSNDYLIGKVNESDSLNDDLLTETKEETKEEIEEALGEELPKDNSRGQEAYEKGHSIQADSDGKNSKGDIKKDTALEELTGPAPVMGSFQEPTIDHDDHQEDDVHHDELPEADDLAEEVGRVHKIYGQKLPKEYLKKDKKTHPQHGESRQSSVPKKAARKKGFPFYIMLLMILASVTVWLLAAYLYFSA